MTPSTNSVAIIIVNYQTPYLVKDCLDRLCEERRAGAFFDVFVGDAASGDGSVGIIQEHIRTRNFQGWIQCFHIGHNGGFAYANNAIFEAYVAPHRKYDYVHFLNPDTLVHTGAVSNLLAFLNQHPEVAVAGSRLENPDGSWRAYGFRFPAPWREFFRGARIGLLHRLVPRASVKIEDLAETSAVDWVTGASFMVRRSVLDEVGLMDDGYFLYFEETDLMARIREAGHAVWHVAESRVIHLAGQSTGVRSEDQGTRRLSPIWLKSRARFMRKFYGAHGAFLANALFLLGDLIYRLKCLMLLRRIQDPPHLWQDYLRPNSDLQGS